MNWLDEQRATIRAGWRFAMYWYFHWDVVAPSEGRGHEA